ncbi:histidine ammonia-lyase [Paenibacillus physcomitrellae]|uniref:Histidine ammonia-lyase n=2 Tax=Paenibacillus physcomitrellae TaxID=1619311 RepID=A0ABQ1FKR7_9BACL|nr:histidine ammonia-lyase [Paenibacillus physcomitrellae]GGA19856.1 histidine ammonia-lyase [Paenibacillus physcomitrellae]
MNQTMEKMTVLTGGSLTIDKVVEVARFGEKVAIDQESLARVRKSRAYVEQLLNDQKVVYGLTTGFGKFSDTYISAEDAQQLQLNLIRSHACGIGEPFSVEVARAIMLLRVNALLIGVSGIRPEVIELMAAMLNRGVTPVIPEKGSLGASGDLAPLSHLALVLFGEGEAYFRGERLPGAEALRRAGLAPVALQAKEGLALINGTQVMTAVGVLACCDAINLAHWADCTAALTAEALLGVRDAFDPLTHSIRPHPGQSRSAENIRHLTAGTRHMTGQGELRVQDAYSLRCAPQVHGASRDGLAYIKEKLEIEINSATDNPLIFVEEDRVISGGNFHGQPIALPMDHLSICASELANISERRIERLVNPHLNEGLPAFLTLNGGLQSGFMIAQYAAAAVVSENKALSHPASVDSIPSSGNQEDHVSMGTIAARKALQIVNNAYSVLAIELLCGAQAADFRDPQKLGQGTRWLYEQCRIRVPFVSEDRVLSGDFKTIADWMKQTDVQTALAGTASIS